MLVILDLEKILPRFRISAQIPRNRLKSNTMVEHIMTIMTLSMPLLDVAIKENPETQKGLILTVYLILIF